MESQVESGCLYVVATPIGNLQDITLRAIGILSQVDTIAAEDTRHSQRLLQQHNIHSKLLALHEHNESQRASQLVGRLQQGESIALISDAGTPLISDPGYGLVNACRQAGVRVVTVPGPCAAIAALSASGLATDRFIFEGFLPVKAVAKQKALEVLINESGTTVFYEAPRRVLDTMTAIEQVLGADRQVVLAKELTKAFETFVSGTAEEVRQWLEDDPVHQKGEFVLMIGGSAKDISDIPSEALSLLKRLADELPLKKAAAIVAEHMGLKKNQLYQAGLDFAE